MAVIPGLNDEPATVKFHSIKSTQFRVVQSDGAWCSVNPQDLIHLIFFNERHPVPQEAVYEVTKDGLLGKELLDRRKVKDGYIRELEVDVVLTKPKATDLYHWLGACLGLNQKDNVLPKGN